ncbi:DUF456 domain-containing protein [Chloroflexota bacterium]
MAETVPLIIVFILMILSILASLLPFVPGPALVWAIGVIYAALTGFESVSMFAVIIMTILMIIGSTTSWWTQALGMRTQGSSCLSMIGSMVGGLIGTIVIPIPFLGTLIGIVIGALIFEFARFGEFRRALRTGSAAATGFILAIIVETTIAIVIAGVFVLSVLLF